MLKRKTYSLHIDNTKPLTPPDVLQEYHRLVTHTRESLELYTSRDVEKKMLLFIQNGDPEGLSQWLHTKKLTSGIQAGAMAENELKQSRCMFMAGLTLYTRAAIDGGLDQELAYNLSDAYIHSVNAFTDATHVLKTMILAALDFAHRVQVAKMSGAPAVKLCRSYISNHLHYKITTAELAALCDRSPNYLSSLFREQVGISLKEYILGEKLRAASLVLLESNLSVAEVASQFAFCSHSNFSDHFKRRFGVTPQVYRAEHARHIEPISAALAEESKQEENIQ